MGNKKIFILRYYWKSVHMPIHRTTKIAEAFLKDGYDVTVITRNCTGLEKDMQESVATSEDRNVNEVIENGTRVIYLPYTKPKIIKGKLATFFRYAKGDFSDNGNYAQLLPYIFKYIEELKPQIIYASVYPLDTAFCIKEISKKFPHIKFAIDFVDYQNITKGIKNRIIHTFENKYLKKWLKNVSSVFTISAQHAERISKNLNKTVEVVYNGYYKDSIQNVLNNTSSDINTFTITILGMLYPSQDYAFMTKGFVAFLKRVPNPEDIKIQFIGLMEVRTIIEHIRANSVGFEKNIIVTSKVPHLQALDLGAQSHVLYYIGWKGYKGMLSTKIFDYLGLRRNILIAPNDKDAVENIVNETNAGKLAESEEEMADILTNWYYEWKTNGELKYYGNENIDKYADSVQYNIVVNQINKLLV